MEKLLLFLSLFINYAYAQDSSAISDLEYYPLETGNYFEYLEHNSEYGTPYFYQYAYAVMVLGDTILDNNLTYKTILIQDIPNRGSGSYRFQRVDSSDGSVYEYYNDSYYGFGERKIDSLFAHPGDYIKCSRMQDGPADSSTRTLCTAEYTESVLGVETKVKEFEDLVYEGLVFSSYSLVQGLGYLGGGGGEIDHVSTTLRYAEVDGEKYGERISFKNLTSAQAGFNYYSLKKGSCFEYLTITDADLNNYDTSAYSITVLGDTTLENGSIYKILLNKGILSNDADYYVFERIDSSDGSVYRYSYDEALENNEYKIDSLFAGVGDTIHCLHADLTNSENVFTICTEIRLDTLLGLETKVKAFEISSLVSINYELARNLGFTNMDICEISCSRTNLVYAEIDGVKYGDKVTGIEESKSGIPQNYYLSQNYPNPFNPVTSITFEIPQRAMVELTIYDIKGARVKTLTKKEYLPGTYQLRFDGANLSSGVYFYRLITPSFTGAKKMVLLK